MEAARATFSRNGASTEAGDPVVRYGLLAIAFYLVGISLVALISPITFFEEVGPFGTHNEHYVRDGATFQLAFGIGAAVASARPRWQMPVILMLALQFLAHALNHLVDIGEADPQWLGPADFIGLAIGTAVLGVLLVRVRRQERAP